MRVSKFIKAWPALAVVAAFGAAVSFNTVANAMAPAEPDPLKDPVVDSIKKTGVNYDNVATLMRVPGVFGAGAACIVCHSGPKARAGFDASSCAGIHAGATAPEDGTAPHAVITPGKHKGGTFRRRMRDNRMPVNVNSAYPNNTAEHMAVKNWIDAGAHDDDNFNNNVLPLFSKKGAFGAPEDQSCSDCHMSNEEPPSFHEMDLTNYKGVMAGADVMLLAPKSTKVVKPGNSGGSKLWLRISENRMPLGIDGGEDRDPTALHMMFKWIDDGAKCD